MIRPGRASWRRWAVVALIVAVAVVPLVVLLAGAVSRQWFFPQVVPRQVGLRPALTIMRRRATVAGLTDGLVIGGLVTVVAVVLAWPAARVLARGDGAWRFGVFAFLFLPSVLPPVGLAIGVDVALLRSHLTGSIIGVVVSHLVPALPYAVGVLTAVFRRYDARTDDQAAVLGATPWQRFRLVTFPLVRPGVAVAGALTFLVSWSQYLLTLLVGSGRVVTITMLLFNALSGANATTVGTLALAAMVPAFVVLAVARRSLAEMSAV